MKILLTGAYQYTDEQTALIRNLGLEVDFFRQEWEIVKNPEKYEAVICNGLFQRNDIEKFISLKYIQLTSAGLDRVPLEYIKKQNIVLRNARGVYSIPMAEWAVLKVLELYKDSRGFYEKQKEHRWDKNRNISDLYSKTVAIIGCGSVGLEAAKRFKAFNTNVIGVDIADISSEYIDSCVNISNLNEVLSVSDVVVLTLPLMEQTYHLFNKDRFSIMKKNAVFINISRGAVADEQDLIAALKEKKLRGAALDVFENEPLGDSEFWNMENVIITPHNSFVGEANADRMFGVIYDNLKEWMKSK